jgi:hypothetical protein
MGGLSFPLIWPGLIMLTRVEALEVVALEVVVSIRQLVIETSMGGAAEACATATAALRLAT